jgi:integral membrane sensor domain MASE1
MRNATRSRTPRRRAAAVAVLFTIIATGSSTVGAPAAEARPHSECLSRTLWSWHTWVSPGVLGPLRYALCRNDLGEID